MYKHYTLHSAMVLWTHSFYMRGQRSSLHPTTVQPASENVALHENGMSTVSCKKPLRLDTKIECTVTLSQKTTAKSCVEPIKKMEIGTAFLGKFTEWSHEDPVSIICLIPQKPCPFPLSFSGNKTWSA